MTRDQIREQFPDATEEQITALLNINGADVTAAKKNNVDPKELKQLREDSEAYKKLKDADLTDAEKIQQAINEAKSKEAEFLKKSNKLDVEKILVGAGLTEEDYKDLIDGLVSEDSEKSKALATNLANMLSKQKETVKQKTKEELMDGTQVPGGKGGDKEDKRSNAEKLAEKFFSEKKEGNDILSHYVGGN